MAVSKPTLFFSLNLKMIRAAFMLSLFVAFFAHAQNNDSNLRCYVEGNHQTFNDSGRKEFFTTTIRGFTNCKKTQDDTYLIQFNGKNVYVAAAAVSRTENIASSTPPANMNYADSQPIRNSVRFIPLGQQATATPVAPSPQLSKITLITPGHDQKIPSEKLNTASGQSISVLSNQGAVLMRDEPNKNSSFACPSGMPRADCREAQFIDSNVALTLTGQRIFDEDNRIWYVEVNYEHKNNKYTSWIDEKQTSLAPYHAQVKENTQTSKNALDIYSEIGYTSENKYVLQTSEVAQSERAQARQKMHFLFAENAKTEKALKTFSVSPRKMIRMHNSRAAVCGSREYSTGSGDESYANPVTACAITQLAERWRKEHCPTNSPCRLEFGDISHPTNRLFDGHSSHTNGECVDIRPIRNSSGTNSIHYKDENYDRAKAEQLLNLIKEMGGTNIFFNDKKMIKEGLTSYIKNHNTHIHVCFNPDNEVVKNQCANYQPDEKMCPSAALMFDHPLMQTMKNALSRN